MYKILVLLLVILEAKITYITFYLENLNLIEFLIIHLLVGITLFFATQYYEKKTFIYNVLTIAIPFIGIFLYLLSLIFKKKNDFHIVDEVFDFEKYIEENKKLKQIDMAEELKLISALDTMEVKDGDEKKAFIIKFKPEEVKVKVKMLKKGLVDKDREVVHYSAVEFNQLSEKFERQLMKLKKQYLKLKDGVSFEELIEFYEVYLKTDILEGEFLTMHRKLYIKLVEERILVEDRLNNHIKILNMYLTLEKYSEIIERCENLLKKYQKDSKIYEIMTILYYELEDLSMLKKMLLSYKKNDVTILKNANNIFKICGIKG